MVNVVSAHMHETCGNFTVVPFAVNDGLDEYRDCITTWYRARHDDELAKNESIVIAARRFNKTVSSFSGAESLVCSKMVKKARCIDDGLHARAVAAASNFNNPTVIIGIAEFKLNLMAPGDGERLRARGEVIKSGRTLTITQGKVWVAKGGKETLCAIMQQTLIAMPQK